MNRPSSTCCDAGQSSTGNCVCNYECSPDQVYRLRMVTKMVMILCVVSVIVVHTMFHVIIVYVLIAIAVIDLVILILEVFQVVRITQMIQLTRIVQIMQIIQPTLTGMTSQIVETAKISNMYTNLYVLIGKGTISAQK